LQVYTGYLHQNLKVNTSAVFTLVKLLPECCRFILGIYSSLLVFDLGIYLLDFMVRDWGMDFLLGN